MNRTFFIIASLSAALAVALGALGAHLLQQWLPPEKINTFEIGVRYQFYHALALMIVALLKNKLNQKMLSIAGWLFVLGILFFSFSLYLLACSSILGLDDFRSILGPMTPIGGVFFILGWLVLFSAGVIYSPSKKSSKRKSKSSKHE